MAPAAPPLLVVNADDFGISEMVNSAIVEAHRVGVVSSATAIANGPAIGEVGELSRAWPQLGVGVHLNTSEFEPLTDDFAAVRASHPTLDVHRARRLSRSTVRAIEAEWRAQIDLVRGLGIEPSHLDSHHFDHVNPILLPSLVRVARSAGVRRVRGMHNLWREHRPSAQARLAKAAHRRAMGLGGVVTTDYMTDASTYLDLIAEGGAAIGGSVEVMAHPGHPGYQVETDRLLEASEFLAEKLTTWRSIGDRRP